MFFARKHLSCSGPAHQLPAQASRSGSRVSCSCLDAKRKGNIQRKKIGAFQDSNLGSLALKVDTQSEDNDLYTKGTFDFCCKFIVYNLQN